MRGSTNKSPNKLNAAENKFDTGDLFTNGENYRGKTPLDVFKITTLENPLLLKQAVTSCWCNHNNNGNNTTRN